MRQRREACINNRQSEYHLGERLVRWMIGFWRHHLGKYDGLYAIEWMVKLMALWLELQQEYGDWPRRSLRWDDGRLVELFGPGVSTISRTWTEDDSVDKWNVDDLVRAAATPGKWPSSVHGCDSMKHLINVELPLIVETGLGRLNTLSREQGGRVVDYLECVRVGGVDVCIWHKDEQWAVFPVTSTDTGGYSDESLIAAAARFRIKVREEDDYPHDVKLALAGWSSDYCYNYERRLRRRQAAEVERQGGLP